MKGLTVPSDAARCVTLMKAGFIILVIAVTIATAHAEEKKALPPVPPEKEAVENRMELILEFDYMVAEFLDRLLRQEMPDVAMVEWCEKTEVRAMGYPKIQQAFGELYIAFRSYIKGDAKRTRIAFQQAHWLIANERYFLTHADSPRAASPKAKP